ncbi:AMP-binding protein [Actinocatenispora rupis]|nr:AMP-binding protein [Actinocatenispora rupis]
MTGVESLRLPSAEVAAGYRAKGWWRDETFLDDLARAVATRPDHPALIAYEGDTPRTISYRELSELVERFAAALLSLGVGRGDVVAMYLPNVWQLTPLWLACGRIGAVGAAMFPSLEERELRFTLTTTEAPVCVSLDRIGDVDIAARVAAAAPDTVRHRVVIGTGSTADALDFTGYFLDTEHPAADPALALRPDEPAALVSTSGTSGRMKAVAHTSNTLYAAARAGAEPYGLGPDDVIVVPHPHLHMAGMTYGALMPLQLNATWLIYDRPHDMALLLDTVERHAVTWAYMAPGYLVDLVAAQRDRARDTRTLRRIVSGSAPLQPDLVESVRETFQVPVHALWGMTENAAVTMTRPDDPDDWATRSDGRAVPWMEVRIDAEDGEESGRLLVRGASQCLGYLHQRDVYDASLDGDWFDTGDIARPDGRGGIRIVGRRSDLIIRSDGLKLPVLLVEGLLARHPGIKELALVGYPDPAVPGAELCCAVVVPQGRPPTLAELHDTLAGTGCARAFWPDRVQFVWELPKNSVGKIQRAPLRRRLELAAAPR